MERICLVYAVYQICVIIAAVVETKSVLKTKENPEKDIFAIWFFTFIPGFNFVLLIVCIKVFISKINLLPTIFRKDINHE